MSLSKEERERINRKIKERRLNKHGQTVHYYSFEEYLAGRARDKYTGKYITNKKE